MKCKQSRSAPLHCFLVALVLIANDYQWENSAHLFVAARPWAKLAQARRTSVVNEFLEHFVPQFDDVHFDDAQFDEDDDDDDFVVLDDYVVTNTPLPVSSLPPSKHPTEYPTYPPEPATTPEPATAQPLASAPITAEPTSSEPTATQPMSLAPITLEPATPEPATAQPLTSAPIIAEPTSSEPTATLPKSLPPSVHHQITDESIYSDPTITSLHPTRSLTHQPTSTNDPPFTTTQPAIGESVHPSATQPPTASSIHPSISSHVSLSGVVNFKLPMSLLSESQLGLGQVAAFEATVEDFLRREMLLFNATITFSNFNSTVVTQQFLREQPDSPSEEPIRLRGLEQTSLIIVANVIALASPAEAAIDFPFQTIIHGILLQNRDEFYDTLVSSGEFEILQEPVHVSVRGGGGNNESTGMIIGGSIAGIGMLISSVVAFFVIKQRHRSQKDDEGADCVAPQIEMGETSIAHFDESSLHGGDSSPSARNIAIKSVIALDEWSVCDEDVMHSSYLTPHYPMPDSDASSTASTFALPKDMYTMNDSMLQSAQEEQNIQSQPNVFTRLFDSTEPDISGPGPNSPRGLKLFGYFVTPGKLFGRNKATDTTRKISGNVYQVWAPPGPLGIVIASSKDGPIICKV